MYNDILYFNFCLLGLIVLSFFYFLFMVVPSWYNKYLAPPFNKEILLLNLKKKKQKKTLRQSTAHLK